MCLPDSKIWQRYEKWLCILLGCSWLLNLWAPLPLQPSKWHYSNDALDTIYNLQDYVTLITQHDSIWESGSFASAAFVNETNDPAGFSTFLFTQPQAHAHLTQMPLGWAALVVVETHLPGPEASTGIEEITTSEAPFTIWLTTVLPGGTLRRPAISAGGEGNGTQPSAIASATKKRTDGAHWFLNHSTTSASSTDPCRAGIVGPSPLDISSVEALSSGASHDAPPSVAAAALQPPRVYSRPMRKWLASAKVAAAPSMLRRPVATHVSVDLTANALQALATIAADKTHY